MDRGCVADGSAASGELRACAACYHSLRKGRRACRDFCAHMDGDRALWTLASMKGAMTCSPPHGQPVPPLPSPTRPFHPCEFAVCFDGLVLLVC